MSQPEAVDLWMQLAQRDLAKARRLAQPPPFPEGVCFYAQQAAEKALKAYCCALGAERVPRTHDLVELADLLRQLGGQPPATATLELLSRYAVAARYEVPMPNPPEAEEALDVARRMFDQVAEQVNWRGNLTSQPESPEA